MFYEFGLELIEEEGRSLSFTLLAQPFIIMHTIKAQQSDDESISYRARAIGERST